ncbi:MAG TPA: hypothetical protein VF013_00165 [Candidatus Limnocylindria bacterium]
MNDNEIERRLRAESGPRERGYVPVQLPFEPVHERVASRLPAGRAIALIGAVAAGVAAVVVGGAILGQGGAPGVGTDVASPTPTSSPAASAVEPSATSAATPSPPLAACTTHDLGMDVESWGGAAGSRGTVVTLHGDANPCELGQPFDVAIRTDTGEVLASGRSPADESRSVVLDAQHPYRIGVEWSNWCGAGSYGQIAVVLVFPGWGEGMVLIAPEGTPDQMPPCMNAAAPPTVSATGLQPGP